jgi:hypothetical protein
MTLWEWGEREPKAATLLKLAGAVGVEPAALLDGVRWEPAAGWGTGRFVVAEDA